MNYSLKVVALTHFDDEMTLLEFERAVYDFL